MNKKINLNEWKSNHILRVSNSLANQEKTKKFVMTEHKDAELIKLSSYLSDQMNKLQNLMPKKIKTQKTCRKCEDPVYITQDEKQMIEDGFTDYPNICDDCVIDDGYADDIIQDFSDADPGL